MTNAILAILAAALVTYLLRALPMTLFRKPIKNRFIRSFLHYLPTITLSVMTFPAILSDAGDPVIGGAAFAVGLIVAWIKPNLFLVALSTAGAAVLLGLLL